MSKQSVKLILIVVAVFAIFGIYKSMSPSVDANQVKEAINKEAFLVDVRTPAEFSGGSVKGAVNIPLSEIESNLNQFKDKESIVVFCRSGGRSSQAKSILESNGFQNVINGGTWQNVNEIINQ